MANSRTTQARDDRQQTSNASQGSPRGAEARQGDGVQGGDRERAISPSRDAGRGVGRDTAPARGMSTNRPTSPGPVYGASSAASPFGLMRRMAEDMDRIFEDFGFAGPGFAMAPLVTSALERGSGATTPGRGSGWAPTLETFRRGNDLVVRADLPGLRKEDVEVEVDDGILTISGERSAEEVEERDGFYHTERRYGRFHRSLALPEGVTGDACEATFENGVLEVRLPLPKQEERKARKIAVK